jgi:hypothetical protein
MHNVYKSLIYTNQIVLLKKEDGSRLRRIQAEDKAKNTTNFTKT